MTQDARGPRGHQGPGSTSASTSDSTPTCPKCGKPARREMPCLMCGYRPGPEWDRICGFNPEPETFESEVLRQVNRLKVNAEANRRYAVELFGEPKLIQDVTL